MTVLLVLNMRLLRRLRLLARTEQSVIAKGAALRRSRPLKLLRRARNDNDAVLMNTPLPPLSLYVHIPWCVRKCPYCDFNSHQPGAEGIPEADYVRMLQADLAYLAERAQGRKLHTVFFGGGTPSLFSARAIGAVLESAHSLIGLEQGCEITLEANPGAFEQERFRDYRGAGVNRLSMGVQSFSDAALQKLGRIHSADEARHAFDAARRAGFDNINLDLMFGLPDQTPTDAKADLQQAIDLGPEHLSWYELTIEPNTAFYNQPPVLPEDDLIANINEAGLELLAEAGYRRYEVSAFARPGRESRHNLNYWTFGDYLGIGSGAHGKLTYADHRISRTWRTRVPAHYLNSSPEGGFQSSPVSVEEQPLEFLMNALRLIDGVPTNIFRQRTQVDWRKIDQILFIMRERGYLDGSPDVIQPSEVGLRYLNQCLTELMPDEKRIRTTEKMN